VVAAAPSRLVVIGGVTGVGKTATAVALAARLPIEVISADSRQVYRGLDVGTGKPSAEEREAVPHHLVDILDPDDRYDAARFRRDAAEAIACIRARGRLPVVVGGTGLYIRALLRGLDPAPPADPQFRAALVAEADRCGRGALHARLRAEAPALAARLHPNDSVRVIRALELARTAPVTRLRWDHPVPDGSLIYVGLTLERARLTERLRARCAAMVRAGLAAEVEGLLARGYDESLPALQGIGYRDFARAARGATSPEEALRTMQRDTVRYAKRQLTWFRREDALEWIDVERQGGPAGVAALLQARLA
jgi:tRNA dimethylallyltransferase